MSFGKLYGFKVSTCPLCITSFKEGQWLTESQGNARTTVLLAVAKANNLDIELVHTQPPKIEANYTKLNALNKVPTFVSADGFLLTEVMAIAIYCTFFPTSKYLQRKPG